MNSISLKTPLYHNTHEISPPNDQNIKITLTLFCVGFRHWNIRQSVPYQNFIHNILIDQNFLHIPQIINMPLTLQCVGLKLVTIDLSFHTLSIYILTSITKSFSSSFFPFFLFSSIAFDFSNVKERHCLNCIALCFLFEI